MMKQKLKKIKLILLISCLSACNSIKPITVANCERQISFITEGNKRYVNEEESFCACRDYKFSKEYIGPIGNEREIDIDSDICRKIVGYPLTDYAALIRWAHSVQDRINRILKN